MRAFFDVDVGGVTSPRIRAARGEVTPPTKYAGLIFCALALALLLGGCSRQPPPAPREFRAAWVASVANIDWPSKPGLPAEQQRAEALAILDRARALKLNAIILQVRPTADALYPSALEPWSEYLTGEQGRPPAPLYDPLEFWIAEAHRRGLELHAWFNPYRARHPSARSPLAPNHIARTHPEAVKTYGEQLWMDPAEPFAVRRTLDVIADVVRRYDLDGVHIDDYFYPYPIPVPSAAAAPPTNGLVTKPAPTPELDFPDGPAWTRYVAGGGKLARADWRREQVNRLVEQIHRSVHAIKPHVRFGVSPFGVGRPDRRPPGIAGFSQYDKLYADVELWLKNGWLDYLAPQLYWPKEKKAQDFAVLLKYWAKQNPMKRHLWPGLFTSSINDTPKSWSPEEITRQIDLTRTHKDAGGHIHFSMIALLQNRAGIATRLAAGPYAQAALVPASPWLDATTPGAPGLRRLPDRPGTALVAVQPAPGKPTVAYAVWQRRKERWHFSVQPAAEPQLVLATAGSAGELEMIVVSAVDEVGNESPRVTLEFKAR